MGEARARGSVWLQRGTWHAGGVHARVQACETTWQQTNEPWMKLEKRYKEYRNPVLILTHGLQTRLCCRFVENHGLKEWHWLGSWGSPDWPHSSVRGECPEVQGSVGSSSPRDGLGSPSAPALLPGTVAGGDMAKEAQRASRGPAAVVTAGLCLFLPGGHQQPHGHWEVVGQAGQLGDKTEFFHLGLPVWAQPLLSVQHVVEAPAVAL